MQHKTLPCDSKLNYSDLHLKSQSYQKLEIVQSFSCKVAWGNSTVCGGKKLFKYFIVNMD